MQRQNHIHVTGRPRVCIYGRALLQRRQCLFLLVCLLSHRLLPFHLELLGNLVHLCRSSQNTIISIRRITNRAISCSAKHRCGAGAVLKR
jgi:hypothetical protein